MESPKPGSFGCTATQMPVEEPRRSPGLPYRGLVSCSPKMNRPNGVMSMRFWPGGSSMIPVALAQWRIEATIFLPTPKRAIASETGENRSVVFFVSGFLHGVEGFFQPAIAQGEGLMAR